MGSVRTRLRTVELLVSRTPESACLESKLKDLHPHIRSSTGDTALVAQRIAERLLEYGNRVLSLGLGPATEVYQRCMMD
jgi:hypothetical protein